MFTCGYFMRACFSTKIIFSDHGIAEQMEEDKEIRKSWGTKDG